VRQGFPPARLRPTAARDHPHTNPFKMKSPNSNRSSKRPFILKTGLVLTLGMGGVLYYQLTSERTNPSTGPSPRPPTTSSTSTIPAFHDSNKIDDVVPLLHRPLPDPTTDARAATIKIGENSRRVSPNLRGEFPRVLVNAEALITARVPFPDAQLGESIAVQAEDGGQIVGGGTTGSTTIAADGEALVEFRAAAFEGMNRVTVRRGAETRVLEFWVGAEPPIHIRQ